MLKEDGYEAIFFSCNPGRSRFPSVQTKCALYCAGSTVFSTAVLADNLEFKEGITFDSTDTEGKTASFIDGSVSNNTVTLNADASGLVYGGVTDSAEAVSNNKLIVNWRQTGTGLYGGISMGSGSGDVIGNTVTMHNNADKIISNITGGSRNANVTDNYVTVAVGTVTGNITDGSSENGNATKNTFNIHNGSDITTATLTGGSGRGDISGNTLNLIGYTGTAQKIEKFDTLTIQNTLLTAGQPVLTLTDTANLTGTSVNLENSGFLGGGTAYAVGEN